MMTKNKEPIRKIEELKEWWDQARNFYGKEHRKLKLLDSTDKGELWKALGAKFPPYQILPDTNFVSYVKSNLVASIYTVAKSAEVQPTSEDDKELIVQLNIALDRIWETKQIGYYQFLAGERAALTNLGITQVGWDDSSMVRKKGGSEKGNISIKNIDPIKFMRDPFAVDLDSSEYCMTYDVYHANIFKNNPHYREEFLEYEKTVKQDYSGSILDVPEYRSASLMSKGAAKGYYTLLIFWVREYDKVHEIHTINGEHILYEKRNIKPSEFPFVELYCNPPTSGTLIGISETARIFANTVAYNIMHSIALTAVYKNQRPPKFISSNSGLNIAAFAKHGDEADRTFVVNGDASRAVHYHEFPQVSTTLPGLMGNLAQDTQLISGVDGRYTGRDTGSIITTGGTEEMLNRVTLIDTPKITTYEAYARRLTKLVLMNFLEHGDRRSYYYRKPNSTKWKTVEVDFPKIDKETIFDYIINISSELPKNKQRIAAVANMLMEKQMQYSRDGQEQVQLITPEEWLMFQDLPNKEFMLERMGVQRLSNALEDVSQVLFEYGDLVDQGVDPDMAMMATAETLQQRRSGQLQPQSAAMGNESMAPMNQEPEQF